MLGGQGREPCSLNSCFVDQCGPLRVGHQGMLSRLARNTYSHSVTCLSLVGCACVCLPLLHVCSQSGGREPSVAVVPPLQCTTTWHRALPQPLFLPGAACCLARAVMRSSSPSSLPLLSSPCVACCFARAHRVLYGSLSSPSSIFVSPPCPAAQCCARTADDSGCRPRKCVIVRC